jgi:uncharacterized protein (DUF362 family)
MNNKVGMATTNRCVYNDGSLLTNLMLQAIYSAGYLYDNHRGAFNAIIKNGDVVVIKPNFVCHKNNNGYTVDCIITNKNLIITVVKEILKCAPQKIIIADAPIQNCEFNNIVTENFLNELRSLSSNIDVCDLRLSVWDNAYSKKIISKNQYCLFDLGCDSMLEPISTLNNFRITNYDSSELNIRQKLGKHEYLIWKDIFDADVIINMPKLKTHCKSGITGALKNIVGINGDKSYLPHHRLGDMSKGGDCYAESSKLKYCAELIMDIANRNIGTYKYSVLNKTSIALLRAYKYLFNKDTTIEGAWCGNDTVWRMVIDLNKILLCGLSDGHIQKERQRTIYTLTDAIIAGDGDGPLSNRPTNLGAITFSSSSCFADIAHAALMRYDWTKIPLLLNAKHLFDLDGQDMVVCHNNKEYDYKDVMTLFGKYFKPPFGWIGKIEYE